MSHDHQHHVEVLSAAGSHEHIHGSECGHIHVHEDNLCARGLCSHIEHMQRAQHDDFRRTLEPDFFENEKAEDDEDDDDVKSVEAKQKSIKLKRNKPWQTSGKYYFSH